MALPSIPSKPRPLSAWAITQLPSGPLVIECIQFCQLGQPVGNAFSVSVTSGLRMAAGFSTLVINTLVDSNQLEMQLGLNGQKLSPNFLEDLDTGQVALPPVL